MPHPKALHFRSLTPVDGYCPHFLSAFQVISHVIVPLRKALIHFYLTTKQEESLEKLEWRTLRAIGKLLKELIAAPDDASQYSGSVPGGNNDDEDDDEPSRPVDPMELYMTLEPCLKQLKKPIDPKDATRALQILLETIQICARTLPLTSHLWVALLDRVGLGLMAKASIVGKCRLIDDGEILQRTTKETILEWCPLVLKKRDTLEEALKEHCARQPHKYDFDNKPYQFEVRIPLLSPEQATSLDTSDWMITRSRLYSILTSYLFLGIDRVDETTGDLDETEVIIPKKLDVSKICEKMVKGSTEYELVGGVLHDEDDYVALLKNLAIVDPDDDDAWKLMESEEVIPMTESDALDFLKGEDEGAPCGTILMYRRCDDQAEMRQLLTDIIFSQVSGILDANHEYYYEEEVIEE